MTSLWLDRSQDRETSTADAPNAAVAVIGAGITGLVAAVLLARGGKRVAVIGAARPARSPRATPQPKSACCRALGCRASPAGTHWIWSASTPRETGKARPGLTQYCGERGVDVQHEDAYTYAQTDRGLELSTGPTFDHAAEAARPRCRVGSTAAAAEFGRGADALIASARAASVTSIEKLLEDALIKVSSVASTLDTLSVRDMLTALIAGERDPHRLAGLARGKMKPKQAALVEALTGRFDDHHAELAQMLLDQIDALDAEIGRLTPASTTAGRNGARSSQRWGRHQRSKPRFTQRRRVDHDRPTR